MILVSACLAGVNCTWDGKNRLSPEIKKMVDNGLAVAICPEAAGGRSIPRTRTEIKGGSGEDVLEGRAKVYDENGADITEEFLKGAQAALSMVKKFGIKEAILKSKSPSCGTGLVYDGGFKGTLIPGDGVTTALLKKAGVRCRDI
ncbi:MAG: DUF523 domain-containing protein [Candidatus Omnitrophica bacterium]|nr:DUF523 domain-containing protein [Candidatus Omnitrophota bacterium]